MLLQTNSYIVPKERRAEHARVVRRFRQALAKLGCDQFEVYEQVGANWSPGGANGRYVQIMRFRDRQHQQAVQAAERTDPASQQVIAQFCDLINFPYQQEHGYFATGFYTSVLPTGPRQVAEPVEYAPADETAEVEQTDNADPTEQATNEQVADDNLAPISEEEQFEEGATAANEDFSVAPHDTAPATVVAVHDDNGPELGVEETEAFTESLESDEDALVEEAPVEKINSLESFMDSLTGEDLLADEKVQEELSHEHEAPADPKSFAEIAIPVPEADEGNPQLVTADAFMRREAITAAPTHDVEEIGEVAEEAIGSEEAHALNNDLFSGPDDVDPVAENEMSESEVEAEGANLVAEDTATTDELGEDLGLVFDNEAAGESILLPDPFAFDDPEANEHHATGLGRVDESQNPLENHQADGSNQPTNGQLTHSNMADRDIFESLLDEENDLNHVPLLEIPGEASLPEEHGSNIAKGSNVSTDKESSEHDFEAFLRELEDPASNRADRQS